MNLHLKEIAREVAAGAHALLVLDGAGYHRTTALEIPDNITLLYLPPYSPELNCVENIREYLRGNKLSSTVYDDYAQIVDVSCQAWQVFATGPTRIASITTLEWAKVEN